MFKAELVLYEDWTMRSRGFVAKKEQEIFKNNHIMLGLVVWADMFFAVQSKSPYDEK